MDTLPTSVSTLKVSGLNSTTPREFHLFKPPHISNLATSQSHLLTRKPNSISNKPTSSLSFNKDQSSPFLSSSQSSSPKFPSQVVHRNAASGYAAALLDVARCNNTLEALERDVQRFSRLLRDDDLRSALTNPFMDDKMKGELMVKQVTEKGRFQKHLVMWIKMMVDKNKVGMVGEVLEEFERIYDELSGTHVALVSSTRKMEEDQLVGIAKRVQKLSGSMKVKVRHLIAQSLP
ncbi:ATP synthase delta chain, chloroplastic-like [Macadamia integrifolia]|uniref:ATP synthase delta chain, chloroplastic-like n=1 Tax=Macadamia integrifolia TaxID=60698 RepID=UPI001C52DD78|nr:ATP synthase delta chain, chloroplastic-like [Macadamia integrifolia]